ncbi:MAG: tetratricopeptide repeat protein [Oscillochloridaceae bacterium]|nr:tetratricopeptide repeat protein [Chloroflexaceae bacterium]MDW8388803.1 tetratricopeptide repeat protein [Oscillochloridaceae bacterium]
MNLLLLAAVVLLGLCLAGLLVLAYRWRMSVRKHRAAEQAAQAEATSVLDLVTRAERGATVAALPEPESPRGWRAWLAEQPRWLWGLMAALTLVVGVALYLLLSPLFVPPAARYIVAVAPFEDGGDGQTGRNVAVTLAREIEAGSQGAIVVRLVERRPGTTQEALELATALSADILIWGQVEPGAVLDSPSLQPRLIYQPTGPYAPNGWDGYLGRFAMPRSYTVASAPINGRATLTPLILALHAYARGDADRAFTVLGRLLEDYPQLRAPLPRALRGNVLWARRAYSAAAEEYRLALQEPSDEQALLANNLGAVLLDGGDPAALSALAEAVRLLEGHDLGELRVNLALHALRENRPGDAKTELEQARNLLPAHAPLFLALATAYRESGRLDEAAAALEAARRARGPDSQVIVPIYRPMYRQRVDAALSEEGALLDLARRIGARGPLLWELEAGPEVSSADLTAARDGLDRAADLSVRAMTQWRQRAIADGARSGEAGFVGSGQAEQARLHADRQRFYQAVVEMEQARVRPRMRSGLRALVAAATPRPAYLVTLEELQRRRPGDPRITAAIGRAYRLQGDLDAAERAYAQTVQLAPQAPEGYAGQGAVARARGDLPQAIERYSLALERNNAFFPARVELAAIAEAQGDLQGAAGQRRALLEQRPSSQTAVALARTLRQMGPEFYLEAEEILTPYSKSSAVAAVELGQLYEAAGRSDAARDAYADALDLDPRSAPALLALGKLAVAENDYRTAERLFRQAARVDEQNVAARLALADLYYGPLNDPRRAVQEYRRALDRGVADAEKLVAIGDAAMAQEQYNLALEAYTEAVALRPGEAAYQHRLSRASFAAKQLPRAAQAANMVLALTPDLGDPAQALLRAEALVTLGDVQRLSGDFESAVNSYNQALQINPALIPARLGLGLVAVGQGNWGVASSYFQTAANSPGGQDDPLAQFWLAEGLLRQGDYAGAEAAYRRALQLQPVFPEAHLGLAHLYRARGDIRVATEEVQLALQQRGDYAEALLFQGKLYQELGRTAEARAAYDASIRANNRIPETFYRRAMLFMQAGREDRAIRDLQRAIRLQENFPEAHYWLGRAYYAQGRLEPALKSFRRAFELNATYVDAVFFIGLVSEDLGRTADAISAYQTVISIDPNSYFASKARDQISRLT